ncbi:hypothetical protein [Arcobacter sp. s6]|jgi:hypothetical protein|uniref:hypothetical protein n=1 Tax=Arcobacter sp. s6 TaxID=3230363 RepID=UPI0034A075DF
MKRNYWPLLFIGIFSFTFGMIIWTIKSAVSVPVIEDKSFMKKYQDVEEHYNDMMDSNVLFRSKYNFALTINNKQFDLTTEDIKYAQRVIEKFSVNKNLLTVGKNSLKLIVTDKITNEKKDVKIDLTLSKTISNDSDKNLTNNDFIVNDKTYTSDFEIKEANNWIITGSFVVDGITGYLYIKTNAI